MGSAPRPEEALAGAHALEVQEVVRLLGSDVDHGLSEEEARSRRQEHGPNRLRSARRRSPWRILLQQLKSVVLLLLALAAAVAIALGQWTEGIAIAAVVVVNTVIGFVSEWRAVRSMEALQRLDRRRVTVRRGGRQRRLAADRLVPGDVVVLSAEDVVPADIRLVAADNLRVEQAVLTGESVPTAKGTRPVAEDAPLADRASMLYKGTSIAEGRAVGVTVATAMATAIGNIASLAEQAESRATPLQHNLDRLGRRLAWITLALAAVVAGAGLLAGQPTTLMLQTAIALGVAAIPEGLPIVATIALARGMILMARRQAVINRLTAVETLGATRIILTDKTGTLTENRMRVRTITTHDRDLDIDEDAVGAGTARRLLEVGVLCNNAGLDGPGHGDPTEIALLEAGAAAGMDRARLLDELPETREVSFDPEVMMMATFHRSNGGFRVAVKGAPGPVLEACDRVAVEGGGPLPADERARRRWAERNRELARGGLRVMALAEREAETDGEDPYQRLCLLGLVGLMDPPREGVREAIASCRHAGIRVVMVTGDQAETAQAVGAAIGLELDAQGGAVEGRDLGPLDDEADRERIAASSIFARVSPEQKLRLVELFQERGEIVAMTGDGVNDAPALKQADIGVAMGRRGTDAARQVADMVLRDDALASIVAAVRQGRIIFANIRRSVMFMLCTNVAEVMAVAGASVAGAPLPLRPLQILYLNVLTDVFPALALGLGRGSPDVMDRPPRPAAEPVLTRHHWFAIGGWSVLVAATVLSALAVGLTVIGLDETAAVTVSFMTLGFAKLWFVFNLSDPGDSILDNQIVRNPWLWLALALCAALLVAAVRLGVLTRVLQTAPPGAGGWATIGVLSAIPFLIGQSIRLVQRLRA